MTPPLKNPGLSKEARQRAMLCHLLALTGLFLPFCNIIVPFIVWLEKRELYNFVDDQGKESLNFQISFTLYFLVLMMAITLSLVDDPLNYFRWIVLVLIMSAFLLIYCFLIVIASVRASEGIQYRYPGTIRFL